MCFPEESEHLKQGGVKNKRSEERKLNNADSSPAQKPLNAKEGKMKGKKSAVLSNEIEQPKPSKD